MKKAFVLFILLTSNNLLAHSLFINEIPDFTQTNVNGKASGNGQQYCGPVSVSNSLSWLASKDINQLELIHKLASKKYMDTSLKNGTGTSGILRGISKYVKEEFGGFKELSYQGWRKHPKKFTNNRKVPDLEWIKSGIAKNAAVWINVGWYNANRSNTEYSRIGGHWVTLVGYENDKLIFHDPSPRAGKVFANEFVKLSKISKGKLVGNKKGLPVSAVGYYKLRQGMHIKSKADYAIIDGAVLLKL